MLASTVDSLLNRGHALPPNSMDRIIATRQGPVRVRDSGGDKPALIMTPDGPNVIEHHAGLIDQLCNDFRVVCFDMPGFGFSRPRRTYDHTLQRGADVILSLMDVLGIVQAHLAFSCANGFFAAAAARRAPQRISHLVLTQTPSVPAMQRWADRIIPGPLRVPVLGQVLMRATRRKAARAWYDLSLPRTTAREPYQKLADDALRHGGCFCLAGLTQGLSHMHATALAGVDTPATVIWGGADHSHKHTPSHAVLDMLPHANLHVFEGCGHFPDLEQPHRYSDLVRGILSH